MLPMRKPGPPGAELQQAAGGRAGPGVLAVWGRGPPGAGLQARRDAGPGPPCSPHHPLPGLPAHCPVLLRHRLLFQLRHGGPLHQAVPGTNGRTRRLIEEIVILTD